VITAENCCKAVNKDQPLLIIATVNKRVAGQFYCPVLLLMMLAANTVYIRTQSGFAKHPLMPEIWL
jgi:hypothetical protein